jgi:hypothetical protein
MTVIHKQVSKNISKAGKNAKINNDALQQILKKINLDVNKVKQKKPKKGKDPVIVSLNIDNTASQVAAPSQCFDQHSIKQTS